jgi:hypothetical protein
MKEFLHPSVSRNAHHDSLVIFAPRPGRTPDSHQGHLKLQKGFMMGVVRRMDKSDRPNGKGFQRSIDECATQNIDMLDKGLICSDHLS